MTSKTDFKGGGDYKVNDNLGVNTTYETLQKNILNLTSIVKGANAKLKALRQKGGQDTKTLVDNHQKDINDKLKEIAGLNQQIVEHKRQLEDLNGKLSTLQSESESRGGRITELESVEQQLKNVQAEKDSLMSALKDTKTELRNVSEAAIVAVQLETVWLGRLEREESVSQTPSAVVTQ